MAATWEWRPTVAVEIRESKPLSEEDIQKFAGRWVAIKDGEVVFASDDPDSIAEWVRRSGKSPDIVRQLPTDPEADVWIL